MNKKTLVLWMAVVLGVIVLGCAGQKHVMAPSPAQILPVAIEITSVERLNDIGEKPPYQKTDTLVFRVNFKLSNPNKVLAKVEDLYFEAKVDDGTPEKTIVLAGSMPSNVIQVGGEMVWSYTEPYTYGGVLGSYALRGVGGAEGLKGVVGKLNELWQDLGADKRIFFIDGHIASSLPDCPNLGIVRNQFQAQFTIPKL